MSGERIVIGIDPGKTGAVAIIGPAGDLEVYDIPTVTSGKGKVEIAHRALLHLLDQVDAVVWLERVGAMPGQGVTSMFRFGQTFGAIEMAVAANALPLEYVTPATWKKRFGILRQDKDAARGAAMQRFPAAADRFARKKDIGRADAALIALYGSEQLVRA